MHCCFSQSVLFDKLVLISESLDEVFPHAVVALQAVTQAITIVDDINDIHMLPHLPHTHTQVHPSSQSHPPTQQQALAETLHSDVRQSVLLLPHTRGQGSAGHFPREP